MTTATATVRRATLQDANAILPLARKFAQRTVYAHFVPYDDETARGRILEALSRGVFFVLDVDGKIVGGIMGVVAPTIWFSPVPVTQELGWFVDDDYRGHGDELRKRFEACGKQLRTPVCVLSDVRLDDAMPNGQLYERAGYHVSERAWIKSLGD